MTIERYTGEAYQNSAMGFHGLAAAQDRARTPFVQSDLSTIQYSIRNTLTGTFVKTAVSLTIADVITNTLDSYGDNFHVTFPSDSFPSAGLHEITFKFTATDTTVTYDEIQVSVEDIEFS